MSDHSQTTGQPERIIQRTENNPPPRWRSSATNPLSANGPDAATGPRACQ